MNTTFQNVIATAQQLPEIEQQELALQIEDMIVQRKIAASEADIKAGRVTPIEEAFDRILNNLAGTYGKSSVT